MTAALALAAMVVALRFIPAGRPHCVAPQLPARRALPPPVAQLSTVSPQTEEEVAVQRAGHPRGGGGTRDRCEAAAVGDAGTRFGVAVQLLPPSKDDVGWLRRPLGAGGAPGLS